jgi:hypothetical protein
VTAARDAATRLLALKVAADWIAAETKRLRESLSAELMVGERVPGALDHDDKDTLLGFVQLTKGRQTVSITDPDAFLAWVEAVAPTEVITTRAVRSSFAAAVLADVRSLGGWVSPDGELLMPDGLVERMGEPVLTTKVRAEADALVREAIASRRLELGPSA